MVFRMSQPWGSDFMESQNILSEKGPTRVIQSIPGPSQPQKSHPDPESDVLELWQHWCPFPGCLTPSEGRIFS